MKADSRIIRDLKWSNNIANYAAKRKVALRVAAQLKDGDVVGVGSGSTSYTAIEAIGERLKEEQIRCLAIPTSYEVAFACTSVGMPLTSLWEHSPDWSFDGADEVDHASNIIKGRGGAMFKEKLLMRASPRSLILIDESKKVERLGQKFPIPVEVHPSALTLVERGLVSLGVEEIVFRLAKNKDGPVITENGNFILDVRFREIGEGLEQALKSLTGVLETGLFWGFPVEILVA
jgi:ribose 5-phosphate isomerase A